MRFAALFRFFPSALRPSPSAQYPLTHASTSVEQSRRRDGGDGELGRAIVQRFLSEGAKVVPFGSDRLRLDELAALAPARVLVVEGDVTRAADIERLVATAARRFGGVDVLVPAADIRRQASLEECTPEFVSGIVCSQSSRAHSKSCGSFSDT